MTDRTLHRVKAAALSTAAVLAAIQLLPVPGRDNPPSGAAAAIESHIDVPPVVAGVFAKACRNCHSNDTQWPWYSRVAPASWLVARDVRRARRAMNLSEWSSTAGRRPETAIGVLAAACAGVRSGRMPVPQYRLLHPESRLTESEKDAFCQWTAQQTARLMREKKGAARLAAGVQVR